MSGQVPPLKARPCKDCGSTSRKTPHPGPRCATCYRIRRNGLSNARRLAYVAKQYNLSPDAYKKLYDQHSGLCHICRYRKGRQVDHDHACCPGKTSCGRCVRGLLCGPCNKFLGFIRDKVDTLQNAIDYLKNYLNRRSSEVPKV